MERYVLWLFSICTVELRVTALLHFIDSKANLTVYDCNQLCIIFC